MKRKKIFYAELAYVLGIPVLALGTALMEKADFGMSMVVAPAYIVHRRLEQVQPWFSFGVAEFVLQAALLVGLSLWMGRFRRSYLFSFVTAGLYGLALDASICAAAWIPANGIVLRLVCYACGMILCAAGVALLFHSYIPPEAYELVVKELAGKYSRDVGRVKTVYDCMSCLAGIALSFAFFGWGRFEGVKAGTILCALVNGALIGWMNRRLRAAFDFRDGLKLRSLFER
ncbi:MAG: DUF6198 family protein [Eubacteriales bacterium]|nr:DUF6198 family protein [Eubacteriales bacterium]